MQKKMTKETKLIVQMNQPNLAYLRRLNFSCNTLKKNRIRDNPYDEKII